MKNVTDHGAERINKRLGLPKRLAERLASEARLEGDGQAAFKGNFRKYLDKMGRDYSHTPIVYKGNVFMFAGSTLITAWPIPQQFRKYTPKEGANE